MTHESSAITKNQNMRTHKQKCHENLKIRSCLARENAILFSTFSRKAHPHNGDPTRPTKIISIVTQTNDARKIEKASLKVPHNRKRYINIYIYIVCTHSNSMQRSPSFWHNGARMVGTRAIAHSASIRHEYTTHSHGQGYACPSC